MKETIERAARAVSEADALLVCAGAGMGVDSGLPDFRGDTGFWKAYPPFARLGLGFVDLANPEWFDKDPELAWGFYGHRLNLYRDTTPHAGFRLLLEWGRDKACGYFVFTSNVDGQFQQAGFAPDRIEECHGSIHFLQCSVPCRRTIWPADGVDVPVDEDAMRATPPLPACPSCGHTARPNVLMFGDWAWVSHRNHAQHERFREWLAALRGRPLVVVECGAGTAVPTVRWMSERVVAATGGTLVRINTREPQVPEGHVGLALGAREALFAIRESIRERA